MYSIALCKHYGLDKCRLEMPLVLGSYCLEDCTLRWYSTCLHSLTKIAFKKNILIFEVHQQMSCIRHMHKSLPRYSQRSK
ncbi:hypothetical protein RRG08_035603 [Elysia crispata]|uniref:Uncharacterized protein n=1 Tax=Elysia crispata TaxID=231223 RepID=A0AAE1B522_9GAST|nr:hypothetical protein RRG08_035603 [Elysia crispata]